MNERIKELAISKGIYDCLCDPYDKYKTGDYYGSVMDDLNKFAELIVRDCVGICNSIEKIDGVAWECTAAIKEHFGIQE
jgi:hypothetical protein